MMPKKKLVRRKTDSVYTILLAVCVMGAFHHHALAFPTGEETAVNIHAAYHRAESRGDDRVAFDVASRAYQASGYFSNYLLESALALANLGQFQEAYETLDIFLNYEPEADHAGTMSAYHHMRGRIALLQRQFEGAQAAFEQSLAALAQEQQEQQEHKDQPVPAQEKTYTQWLKFSQQLRARPASLPACADSAPVRAFLSPVELQTCLNPALPAEIINRALFSLGDRKNGPHNADIAVSHVVRPWLKQSGSRIAALHALGKIAPASEINELFSFIQNPDPDVQQTAVEAVILMLQRHQQTVPNSVRQQMTRQLLGPLMSAKTAVSVREQLVVLLGTLRDKQALSSLKQLRQIAQKVSQGDPDSLFPNHSYFDRVDNGSALLQAIDQALQQLR